MTKLETIKERQEKVYILADEDSHKLLSTMKEDISYLLSLVEKMEEVYYKEHRD
jgi:hypothetical protein